VPSAYTAHAPIDPEALVLTRAQAGRLLNCSPNTISNLVKRGELRWVEFGGAKMIRRVDVEELVNRN